VAALRDAHGTYAPGFLVLIGLAIAGAIAVAYLPDRGSEAPAPAAPQGA
jgi:hypothetical protein